MTWRRERERESGQWGNGLATPSLSRSAPLRSETEGDDLTDTTEKEDFHHEPIWATNSANCSINSKNFNDTCLVFGPGLLLKHTRTVQ